MDKPILKDTEVRITNSTPLGHKTAITINGNIIPVMAADIRIRPDELVEATIVVRAKDINLVALKNDVLLRIEDNDA